MGPDGGSRDEPAQPSANDPGRQSSHDPGRPSFEDPGSRMVVAGIMSGTSLDGVDVAVMEVAGTDPETLTCGLLAFHSVLHPESLRDRLRRVMAGSEGSVREVALLHVELGRSFARALTTTLEEAGIDPDQVAAAGSHGQTLWHEPPAVTLQLGCAHTLAEATGVPVVSDFRSRDVAAGGEGAPLVPWADWVLFRRPGVGRALQNLGGMGNVTFLPADQGPQSVLAFDTGPGVALLDGAARRASQGREAWDHDGRRALAGELNPTLLAHLMEHPFLRRPPPRSTGREAFGEPYLDELVGQAQPASQEDWNDLLATLTAFTARSVARSYQDFLPGGGVDEVVLTGGGARNPALVQALTRFLDPIPVRTGPQALSKGTLGTGGGLEVDPDAREAVAFALLAWAHLRGVPGNLPQVTGAEGPRVLGSWTPGAGHGGPRWIGWKSTGWTGGEGVESSHGEGHDG